MIFAKIYVISNFSKQNPFLLVSVAKIAHLSANVNPVFHKKSDISAHRIFILHTNIRQVFPESCTDFFQIRIILGERKKTFSPQTDTEKTVKTEAAH